LLFIETTWPLTNADFADNKKLNGATRAFGSLLICFVLMKIILTVLPFLPTSLAKLLLLKQYVHYYLSILGFHGLSYKVSDNYLRFDNLLHQ